MNGSPGTPRKIFSFIFACALAFGGSFLAFSGGLRAILIPRAGAMGLFLAAYGFYWLWTDFISPAINRAKRTDA